MSCMTSLASIPNSLLDTNLGLLLKLRLYGHFTYQPDSQSIVDVYLLTPIFFHYAHDQLSGNYEIKPSNVVFLLILYNSEHKNT